MKERVGLFQYILYIERITASLALFYPGSPILFIL
jgi:hypothetical protein